MDIRNVDTMENLLRVRKDLLNCIKALKTSHCIIGIRMWDSKHGEYINAGESTILQEDFVPVFENQLKQVESEIQKVE